MSQPTTPNRLDRGEHFGLWSWCAALVCFFSLYALTAQRGVSWQDSGMLQWRVLQADYVGEFGLALAHPLYIALGRLVAILAGDRLPLGLNLLSGLGMACALANLAGCITALTRRLWAGLLTAVMLAVSHAAWFLSTVAEVYTWTVAGLTAELWLLIVLIRRPGWTPLVGLACISGLGWSLHNLALLPLPVYLAAALVLTARGRLPAWSLAAGGLAYVVGALPYLSMIAGEVSTSGELVGPMRSALVGRYAANVFNVTGTSEHVVANLALSALSFANLLLPLAVFGWWKFSRRCGSTTARALSAVTVVQVLFFVRYDVPDQFTFILPTMVVVSLAAGVGLAGLAERSPRSRRVVIGLCLACVFMQPAFYMVAPTLAKGAGMVPARARILPFRDEARYWLVPWKHHERSAQRFATVALASAEPDGIILSDSTAVHPLLLVQELQSLAPGVAIQSDGYPLPLENGDLDTVVTSAAGRPIWAVAPADWPFGGDVRRPPGGILYRVFLDAGASGAPHPGAERPTVEGSSPEPVVLALGRIGM